VLNFNEFIEDGYEKVEEYVVGIESGDIISNDYIKQAVQRYKNDLKREDIEFRHDKFKKVLRFFALSNIPIGSHFAQFNLIPFQAFILANLFGLYYKDTNTRKYNYALIWMARKQGKTSFVSLLNLYLMTDGESMNSESVLVSNNQKQATIALDMAKSIVRNSEVLKEEIDILQYQLRNITQEGSINKMFVVPAVYDRLDGFNPYCAIFDEVAGFKDDKLFNVINSGTDNRENPLLFLISTAGLGDTGFLYQMIEYGKDVLNPIITDVDNDNYFFMLYTLDEESDIKDPKMWVKSNPGLGKTTTLPKLIKRYNAVKKFPSQLDEFLAKNLNIFTSESTDWVANSDLDKVFAPINLEEHYGKEVFLGLDMSYSRDLSSLSMIIPDPDNEKVLVKVWFFAPDNVHMYNRKTNFNVKNYISKGEIIQCKSPTIDYDMILDKIKWVSENFYVNTLGYDAYNTEMIVQQARNFGMICNQVPQTFKYTNPPLKYMEKLIYDEGIIFDDTETLKWMFRNVVISYDNNYNIKADKKKSKDSIDGIVATMDGIYEYYRAYINPMLNSLLNSFKKVDPD